jgi:hypothetical protein
MRRASIRVFCDEESHAPRVANAGHLEYGVADDRPHHVEHREEPDTETLHGDELLAPRGDPMLPADVGDAELRVRHVFQCDLCGLRVELRQETAEKLVAGLVAAGVPSVRLSVLAASL